MNIYKTISEKIYNWNVSMHTDSSSVSETWFSSILLRNGFINVFEEYTPRLILFSRKISSNKQWEGSSSSPNSQWFSVETTSTSKSSQDGFWDSQSSFPACPEVSEEENNFASNFSQFWLIKCVHKRLKMAVAPQECAALQQGGRIPRSGGCSALV